MQILLYRKQIVRHNRNKIIKLNKYENKKRTDLYRSVYGGDIN